MNSSKLTIKIIRDLSEEARVMKIMDADGVYDRQLYLTLCNYHDSCLNSVPTVNSVAIFDLKILCF